MGPGLSLGHNLVDGVLSSYTTAEEFYQWEHYLDVQKRATDIVEAIPDVDISKLVDNQRRIFLRVVSHYRQILAEDHPPPLRINIDGTAGTGKSYLKMRLPRR